MYFMAEEMSKGGRNVGDAVSSHASGELYPKDYVTDHANRRDKFMRHHSTCGYRRLCEEDCNMCCDIIPAEPGAGF